MMAMIEAVSNRDPDKAKDYQDLMNQIMHEMNVGDQDPDAIRDLLHSNMSPDRLEEMLDYGAHERDRLSHRANRRMMTEGDPTEDILRSIRGR
jgi:hypothetical protein